VLAGLGGGTEAEITALAVDGRVTLSRTDRLLDDGPKQRWKATWPPDVGDLLARRSAAIEQRHHPTVVLEGSGTFVADDAGALRLPDTSGPADVLRTDFLPYRSPLSCGRVWSMNSTSSPSPH
jgi:2,5-diamino-6-(ribosylamino)-4(3H)-pyrimidinone 5'-phosphate reductase